MTYQLISGEPALDQETLEQQIAVTESASAYDTSKDLDQQEPYPESDEALKGLTGPLNSDGTMQEGYTFDAAAVTGAWIWTIAGPLWFWIIPWIRIVP